MSTENQLSLSKDCKLVAYTYDPALGDPIVSLEYVEHSQDCWHSNTETSVDLTPAKVREIVDFLTPFAAPAPMAADTPNPHPPTTPHRATPEQWRDQERWAKDADSSCILELRDTLAALERRVEELESKPFVGPRQPTVIVDMDERLQRAVRAVLPEHEAPAPAAAPASDDAWQEFIQELHNLQERALGEGIGPRCDMVEWARLLWEPPATAAAPAPPGELVTEGLRDQWFERYESQTRHPLGLLPVAAEHGYRLGFQAAMASQGEAAAPAPPAGSLVEVVARAIRQACGGDFGIQLEDAADFTPEARAASAAIAQALRERGQVHTADWLEREVGR